MLLCIPAHNMALVIGWAGLGWGFVQAGAVSLIKAAENGHHEVVRLLVDKGALVDTMNKASPWIKKTAEPLADFLASAHRPRKCAALAKCCFNFTSTRACVPYPPNSFGRREGRALSRRPCVAMRKS